MRRSWSARAIRRPCSPVRTSTRDVRAAQRPAIQLCLAGFGELENGSDLVGGQARNQFAHVGLRPQLLGHPREIPDLERRISAPGDRLAVD